MQSARPRYVLIAETECVAGEARWRFALHAADASETVAACDREAEADEDRLTLLAVVRGLEALDQPAEVTVVTRCASVLRGLTRGLDAWRANRWTWERFGRLIPIRDADLWRRVDQALAFHTVRCRGWRTDRPTRRAQLAGPHFALRPAASQSAASQSVASRTAEAAAPRPAPADKPIERLIDGRIDSPAMVIVSSPRTRRRVRIAEPCGADSRVAC